MIELVIIRTGCLIWKKFSSASLRIQVPRCDGRTRASANALVTGATLKDTIQNGMASFHKVPAAVSGMASARMELAFLELTGQTIPFRDILAFLDKLIDLLEKDGAMAMMGEVNNLPKELELLMICLSEEEVEQPVAAPREEEQSPPAATMKQRVAKLVDIMGLEHKGSLAQQLSAVESDLLGAAASGRMADRIARCEGELQ